MFRKCTELILMALFFGFCLWAEAGEAATLDENLESSPNSSAKAVEAIQELHRSEAALSTGDTKTPLTSFLAWKAQRVQRALEALRAHKQATSQGPNPGDLSRQLEYNLEMAHGLTVLDYFSLYLKHKSPEEVQEVVKTLTPSQTTKLLMAYAQLLDKPAPIPEPPSESIPQK